MSVRSLIAICVGAALALGCGQAGGGENSAAAPSTPSPTPADQPATPVAPAGEVVDLVVGVDPATAVGKTISLSGVARNAKIAAAVIADHLTLYCLDKPMWSDDLGGKPVTITGVLEKTDRYASKVSETGEVSAGTSGGDYVVAKCEVAAAKPATP